jgi:hypothetical protein
MSPLLILSVSARGAKRGRESTAARIARYEKVTVVVVYSGVVSESVGIFTVRNTNGDTTFKNCHKLNLGSYVIVLPGSVRLST